MAEPGSAEALPHPSNPIGRGWTRQWERLPTGAEIELPLIEDPAAPVAPGRPLPPPHGFGPVAAAWRRRLDHAGTYDEAWLAEQAPLPPADFSPLFHQAAPAGQVYPGELRGGETVEIDGLHEAGPYAFRLPQIVLESTTHIGTQREHARPRIVGVAIDGTAQTLAMIWNATVPCNGRDHLVDSCTLRVRQMAGVAA